MTFELIQLSFDKIMQTRSYTVVVLSAQEKRFAIYMDPNTGKTRQMFLTDMEKPRPTTHDLMDKIFEGFEMQVKQIIINDVQDTIYFARLFLETEKNNLRYIVEIDSRPSDCLILALMNNAPVYCTREVLNKTIEMEE